MTVKVKLEPFTTDSLALAVVASSDEPVLLLDEKLCVIEGSASFCRAFRIDPASMRGKPIFRLGDGEWDTPPLRSLLEATLTGSVGAEACEMDLVRKGSEPRRLVLRAHTLRYGDDAHARMVLAVSDVTDARQAESLKNELLEEKALLLKELQHRVANSLQIIASVLLQSARKVGAGEVSTSLYDAHSRVMSVAALQRHLAVSHLGDVHLKDYFKALCESIGASMIGEKGRVSLTVNADDSVCTADVSVSLGLVVTELVINALKHAFPDERSGKIAVDYCSDGPGWALTVADDGIGMMGAPGSPKSGLGTNIVLALAKQLHAVVELSETSPGDAFPGSTVRIVHGAVS